MKRKPRRAAALTAPAALGVVVLGGMLGGVLATTPGPMPVPVPVPVQVQVPAEAARVRPPAEATCPPDQLTMYGGQVLRYRRLLDRTEIGIRTDWGTTETVTIKHPGSSDPSRWFLVERKAFEAADWARIERRAGQLLPGLRAAAWVCDDGRNPVVDWQPPRAP